MTPLARLLEAEIALTGPLPVGRYMALALGHPQHGYYMHGRPFGRGGDFITAPEISQMFGELLGLWCADTWTRLGRPAQVNLVELGPGRGTLMADALRALQRVPGLRPAIHLVETSPTLRAAQAAALRGHDVAWHDSFDTVPGGPLLLLANEFFDALPVRQFVRLRDGWHERLVGLAPGGAGFAFVAAPDALPLDHPAAAGAPEGSIVETCPAGAAIAAAIGARVARDGGAALIVDYGHAEPRAAATLQAVRGHARHDVLAEPGLADLTAHVDFAALATAARQAGAAAFGPISQGALLGALGIAARAARLQRDAADGQAAAVAAALHRLVAPDAMGDLFKALALAPPELGPPAGFA